MDPTCSHLEAAHWLVENAAAIRLSGWAVFTDGRPIAKISVACNGRPLANQPPKPRPDVQSHHGGAPAALLSGFTLLLPPVEPSALLELQVTDELGRTETFNAICAGDLPGRGPAWGDYAAWASSHDPDPPPTAGPAGPLFSILLPVYQTPLSFLRECLDSVSAQYYQHWELIAIDDASGDESLTVHLQHAAARDPRIRLLSRPHNGGIARATNDALASATGEFVVMLDHDDCLRPHALAEFAWRLANDPTLDALYSDEDKITAEGRRILPLLKPDFSPEFLLGVMYVGHALCVRTTLARAAGGFDPAFDGVQDYEFFLRLTEHSRRIGHVDKILYHWRQSPGSSALHGNVKGDMNQKQADAVRAHLRRRGDPRTVVPLGGHRLRLQAPASPSFKSVHLALGASPLAALQTAALQTQAEVLVLLEAPAPAWEAWLPQLTALAARPDSGLVAPVLLSREGRILECGWTLDSTGCHRPLMRGFDPAGDGNNGTLTCDREVAAVSPRWVAVRRELAVDATGDWWAFCAQLRAKGLYHRVCAAARVSADASWRDAAEAPGPAATDSFFNRHFDRKRADYSLAATPHTQFHWHLDTPPEATLRDGCLGLRGWCFKTDGQHCQVRVTVGGLTWTVSSSLPRPDVAEVFPQLTSGACGFSLRLRVPPGSHVLTLEALSPGGNLSLLQCPLAVPRRAPLLRWLAPDPTNLLSFQLMAGPSRAPRAIRQEKFPAIVSRPHPRLSIVTPSYNQARFLGETMQSVLNQAPAVEYVVQDGGSTDGSVELIRAQATKLSSWESALDSGQAAAVARGFARTSGNPDDIMAWINSDDFYLPGSLGYVAGYFARHPEADVIYGHRILVDESSREVGRWFMPPHDDEVLRLNDFVPQETLFWRRRIWDRVGGIDPGFKFAMDWDLLLRFSQAGARMVRVPHFLACFRLHPTQKTSAAMHDIGQQEINLLRRRVQGREISPAELAENPHVFRYLRQSAMNELFHTVFL